MTNTELQHGIPESIREEVAPSPGIVDFVGGVESDDQILST